MFSLVWGYVSSLADLSPPRLNKARQNYRLGALQGQHCAAGEVL